MTVDALPDQSASTNDKFLKSTGAAGAEVWTDVTVPTKVGDLTNDTGFITASDNITGSSGSCTGNSDTATTASKVANSLTVNCNVMLLEIVENGQYLYEQKWTYRNGIEKASQKEDLDFEIEFKYLNVND